jgi:hypothetical protein
MKTEFSEEEYVWDEWGISTNSVEWDAEFVPFNQPARKARK